MKPEPILWLSDARGVYIPRDFAQGWNDRSKNVTGVSLDYWRVLDAGPDHEDYWDVWTAVLDNATVRDDNDQVFDLHQDGDLWLIPRGMVWNDATDWFEWPSD